MSNSQNSASQNPAEMSLPIIVRAQYIRDLSFENPNPLTIFTSDSEIQPNIGVSVQAKAQNLGERNFEVVLDIKVEAKREEDTMFVAELSYAGVVTVANEVEEINLNRFVMVEAPHLLFPYARNIISDMTRDGGYPPLMLSPVDFAALFHQQAQPQQSQATIN
ncbi:protein-export chaperone SecB [Candidatus Paracaedibacter symbiosus]|uniref:protein-export chaperone SecB n=1 Tax=Candidatus Paracaedibacter symbiosus TaxID=244582 RepID=UPI00068C9A6D|nr:protein-export chaperone SecB [Candidatus Paracaedibacter symbiosus]